MTSRSKTSILIYGLYANNLAYQIDFIIQSLSQLSDEKIDYTKTEIIFNALLSIFSFVNDLLK